MLSTHVFLRFIIPLSCNHSWALTDWSVTSGTGLTMMPECRCRTKQHKLTENYRCRTELFIGIPASVHPCMCTVQVHAAWQNPCCVSMSMAMSILHVHVHAAYCCIPCQCFMSMSMSIDIYIEMPKCRTVRHPVSPVPDWKKLTMPKQVRYGTKLTQSGIFLVRYRTKIWDAGMPITALVSSMPMPSYACNPPPPTTVTVLLSLPLFSLSIYSSSYHASFSYPNF